MDGAGRVRHDAWMEWLAALVLILIALHVGWYANGFVRANQARKNAQQAARKSLPGLSWLRFKLFRQMVAWGALCLAAVLLWGWMKVKTPQVVAPGPSPSPSQPS